MFKSKGLIQATNGDYKQQTGMKINPTDILNIMAKKNIINLSQLQ
jgi:hypothetical protein